MSFTAADRDAVKAALVSGVTLLRFADGRTVQYQSAADLRALLAQIEASLAAQGEANPASARRAFAVFR